MGIIPVLLVRSIPEFPPACRLSAAGLPPRPNPNHPREPPSVPVRPLPGRPGPVAACRYIEGPERKFDDDANIFYGEVINLRDVVTFQGETVKQLRKAFRDSIDDYLESCAERSEFPEKSYSGKFIVRVEPELHKAVAIHARMKHKSLNAWVRDTLELAAK